MPELVHHQLGDGPHVGEPTSGRGEIERRARTCLAATCRAGLDSTVLETRFNVVRSTVPETVTTARKLRDYLPPEDQRDPWMRAEALLSETAMTVGACSRGDHSPSPSLRPR